MAITAVNNELFGAAGVSDPYAFEPGLVGIKRRVNFNVANSKAGIAYSLIPVPKGMVITGIRIEEPVGGATGTFTLKICDGEAEDIAVGAAVTAGTTPKVQNLATPVVVEKNSVVCLVTSAQLTAGSVVVTVIGYLADGESIEAIEMDLPTWRAGQTDEQFMANVSGGDAYSANRNGAPIYPVGNDQ